MTYADVLDWLYAQLPMFQRTGPVRYCTPPRPMLCARPWATWDGLEVIHIAGTNGKDRSHAVAAALQARGLKVGLYTSPHPRSAGAHPHRGRVDSEADFIVFVADHMAVWEELQPSFLS